MKKKKIFQALGYVYLIWLAINLYALSHGLVHPTRFSSFERRLGYREGNNNSPLFPLESSDLGTYDFSEFCLYAIAIPLILFALYKLFETFRKST